MGEERKTVRDYLMAGGLNGRLFHSVRPDLGRPYKIEAIVSSNEVRVTFLGKDVPTRTLDHCLNDLEVDTRDRGYIAYTQAK